MGSMRPRAPEKDGWLEGVPLGERPSGGEQEPEEKAPTSSFLGRVWVGAGGPVQWTEHAPPLSKYRHILRYWGSGPQAPFNMNVGVHSATHSRGGPWQGLKGRAHAEGLLPLVPQWWPSRPLAESRHPSSERAPASASCHFQVSAWAGLWCQSPQV